MRATPRSATTLLRPAPDEIRERDENLIKRLALSRNEGVGGSSPPSTAAPHHVVDRVLLVHRVLVLYPPPADPDHFRSYYEETHLKLVAEWPGLRGYSYAFDVAAAEGDSPYFCVFEADFDDAAAMAAAQGSPQGQATRADVANYATGGVVVVSYEVRAG